MAKWNCCLAHNVCYLDERCMRACVNEDEDEDVDVCVCVWAQNQFPGPLTLYLASTVHGLHFHVLSSFMHRPWCIKQHFNVVKVKVCVRSTMSGFNKCKWRAKKMRRLIGCIAILHATYISTSTTVAAWQQLQQISCFRCLCSSCCCCCCCC